MKQLLLITFLVLSSSPAYAEWILIDNGKPGMTIYVNPDTIHRTGDRVKMWELFDFKKPEKMAGEPHLSFKMHSEYDCTKEGKREGKVTFFSGNMGRGKVVYRNSAEHEWEPVPPGSVNHDLWEFACGKGQSSGQIPAASTSSGISIADLRTLQMQAAQGHAEAQYSLGVLYASGRGVPQGYSQAAKWYEQAAAQGQSQAQFNLGWLYYAGLGVPQDYKKATQWYKQAAAQGHAGAQNSLGVVYQKGLGVPQDYAKARQWYEQAATQEDGDAQNNLGLLYYAGHGVPQDYGKAREWYEQAAAQGHARALGNLAELYYAGLGVPQDDVRAYMWINLAAAHLTGDDQKQAVGNRDEVTGRMTPAQIAEAQRLAQQCQRQQFKDC